MATVVGPGSQIQQDDSPDPLLQGASEYEYVTLLNPLPDDFQVLVAQDVPVDLPFQVRGKTAMIQNEADVVKSYGIGLKNPDHTSRKYIHNTTIIPAGKTVTFRGNEAQVAVKQLVNEIMQREGNRKLLADPNLRHGVEERVVVKRGPIQELLQGNIQTPRTQVDEAINQANEVLDEKAFPTVAPEADRAAASEAPQPEAVNTPSPKRVGRPKKADS